MMTAMLELPGVKKADLQLTMSVCPYSRVRQLTVSGTSRPALPGMGTPCLSANLGSLRGHYRSSRD
ncbi:hypothetical protein A0H81_02570 [Grifola frondosa]|uniref:Uncharacterized protein n=1 Tax=Grifola frondosa TaxID=5627 RepID=A0A1C7MM42_GRIFR|nr:hypothetical protein A0H81_02570 [Grifola frondosa]